MDKAAVLIVEDEGHVAAFTRKCLESMGYEVTGVASDADLAFKAATVRRPDLVLMDIGLDGPMDGTDAAREMRLQYNLPVVFLTGSTDERTLERAKQAEPLAYIVKPFEPKELQATIETAIHLFNTTRSRAAEAVREVEEKYRAIFENATIGIFQVTPTGQVLTANPAMARMLGYDNSLDLTISCVDIATSLLPDESRRLELVNQLERNAVIHNH
jgi:DNA-binding response OmpR family regulator